MPITLKDVEKNTKPLGGKVAYDKEFIFDLLSAYGRSLGNITRLRSGQLNVSDDPATEVAQKGIVYFKATNDSKNLYAIIDDLQSSPTVVRYSTRFVVVTDYRHLLAVDTKTGETLDIDIRAIDRHYTFFLPWAGMEKAQFIAENHADVKAAEKMARLFDILVKHNGYTTAKDWHTLSTFFTRLLFCFFAEDTDIFQKNQFINAIGSYTQEDGSDLKSFLTQLFESLDSELKDDYPAYLAAFPYVNGKLFRKDSTPVPNFNKEARELLIEASSRLDWSGINPDIFGSMFQAVVRPGKRTGLGQHYTSVPNIMKTIEPLFLNELKEEFDNAYDDGKKLETLLGRIGLIKIFDPACGSGNFLVIAYKELRKLEHAILERLGDLKGYRQQAMFGSRINIENFYGIEIDEFAHEIAILSLWLAKHQMNLEFTEKFGLDLPLIPLKEAGNIIRGNATEVDWGRVCPNNGTDEIYLISNPPYLGSKRQSRTQKAELALLSAEHKTLDYVAAWFLKGSNYIAGSSAQLAFVSVNSITQGEQIGLLWPSIFKRDLEIGFAYTSFKWSNNAKGSAGVTCVIVGLRTIRKTSKYLYTGTLEQEVENINAYLAPSKNNLIIDRRTSPLSDLPRMEFGNMPMDGGNLLLNSTEKTKIIAEYPQSTKFIKRLYGSREFVQGIERWCLWISDAESKEALEIPSINARVLKTREMRMSSNDPGTRKKADKPYSFREMKMPTLQAVIVPRHTSEKRDYIPIGYTDKNSVIADSANAIYDPKPHIFGLISSRMHMAWVNAVAGRLKTDLRYSSAIVYNNFPIPPLTEDEKSSIAAKVQTVLDTREGHSEKNLSQMYSPEKMPGDLRLAHQELDEVVDGIYRKKPFENDEERLAHLFNLYETMTINKREKNQ
jgi:hypothetical protein